MTEMLAGNGACNRNCNGNEQSCNGFVAEMQRQGDSGRQDTKLVRKGLGRWTGV